MASVKQSIKTSLISLLANKVRSFLTMLGVIIGVGAVIVIISVGAGAQSLILSQIKILGSDLIGVLPGKSEENGPPASAMGIVITTLTYEDAMALADKNNVPNMKAVVAYSKGAANIKWRSNSYDTTISGVSSGYMDVEGGEIESGRFLYSEEDRSLSKIAILGYTVKKELFGDSDPIGQKIKIKNHSFEVVGVMKERGSVAFQDYDDQVFIPIKTMQKLIVGVDYIGMIRAKVDHDDNIDIALEDVKATLRERHDITAQDGSQDDFTARSAVQALDVLGAVTDALRFFLAAMAALSLVVGGIGIMNIMLVSVTERTREIGLRKAVGANNANILNQFLLEAVAITVLGGVIGIVGGVIVSFLIAFVAKKLGYDWEFLVTLNSIFTALGVSVVVGIIFGIYPASKAAKLEPVEALRYE